MKKVYIAARAINRSEEVAAIQSKLIKMGYELAYDWPAGNNKILKPYRNPINRHHNLAAQKKMLIAAGEADIFILLVDTGLRGAYVEFGAFLYSCIEKPNKQKEAFVVGPKSVEREHIFESPLYVRYFHTIDEVYEELK